MLSKPWESLLRLAGSTLSSASSSIYPNSLQQQGYWMDFPSSLEKCMPRTRCSLTQKLTACHQGEKRWALALNSSVSGWGAFSLLPAAFCRALQSCRSSWKTAVISYAEQRCRARVLCAQQTHLPQPPGHRVGHTDQWPLQGGDQGKRGKWSQKICLHVCRKGKD